MSETVFVTGASRGLGRAIAEAFGARGAWVAVGCRRRADEAERTLASLRARGGDGEVFPCDVREPGPLRAAVDAVLERRGRVDVAVHCAGVARDAMIAAASVDDIDDVLRTNLHGALHLARALARPMMAARGGRIVFVGSVAGMRASVGQASYSASKGGVAALTATLAAELGPSGVRVNAVVPGLIAAGMVERLPPKLLEGRRERIPLGRLGRAEEVAAAVVFLASEASSYVTGQSLVVDGGLSL